MKKFAVVLAGCGVFDGAEIHEASLTLLSIMQHGGVYKVFAPDTYQYHVINHITGSEMPEKRNVLVESARIARGKVSPLTDFNANDFDALIFPGGFGVAKNLCNFAFKGADCSVNEDVAKAIKSMHASRKPIGALCISPVLLSRVFGKVELTIGDDRNTITSVEKMGSKHIKTTHGEVIHDHDHHIFTTPCYMLDANILQIYEGTTNIVKAMMESME